MKAGDLMKSSHLLKVLFISVFMSIASCAWAAPREVKVLVLSMFEVGENTGDFAGEFQHWYEGYFTKAESLTIKGHVNPLFVNVDGIAGTVVGMGKAEAAATLTAILSDQRLDFSHTYILVSGCGGISPERGTLGDVIWVDELVDYELGHGWQQSDMVRGNEAEGTFLIGDSYRASGHMVLNRNLAQWAFDTTKQMKLKDASEAREYRRRYGLNAALLKPSLRMGLSITADSYWHGKASSKRADEVASDYGAGTYMITQMEDSAFGIVARRFGLLDRLLICRDVVNFDQPYKGQTVPESLKASSGGFSIGMTNNFNVARVVVDDLVQNWKIRAKHIPGLR